MKRRCKFCHLDACIGLGADPDWLCTFHLREVLDAAEVKEDPALEERAVLPNHPVWNERAVEPTTPHGGKRATQGKTPVMNERAVRR